MRLLDVLTAVAVGLEGRADALTFEPVWTAAEGEKWVVPIGLVGEEPNGLRFVASALGRWRWSTDLALSPAMSDLGMWRGLGELAGAELDRIAVSA
jgi:hypothetical protein